MIDRLSVAHSNIEEALRMLNPLESNQDYNFKAFFFFFSKGPTCTVFGCRRCNIWRRERNTCFIAVGTARLPFQVSDRSTFLQSVLIFRA